MTDTTDATEHDNPCAASKQGVEGIGPAAYTVKTMRTRICDGGGGRPPTPREQAIQPVHLMSDGVAENWASGGDVNGDSGRGRAEAAS